MVGPGEVDEELEAEVAEECSKYGKVIKCMIFEVSSVVWVHRLLMPGNTSRLVNWFIDAARLYMCMLFVSS